MLKSWRMWLGLAISVGFLALFLTRIDLREMAAALAGAKYVLVIPSIIVYFASVWFRTLRWRLLLNEGHHLTVGRLYPVVVVGYMANNLLPVRLGEVVRSYYVGEREKIPKAAALATIIVERVFDGLVLLFLLVVAALFLPFGDFLGELGEITRLPLGALVAIPTVPFFVALGVFAWMSYSPGVFLRIFSGIISPLPPRLRRPLIRLMRLFTEGLFVLQNPRRIGYVLILSLPVWLLEATVFYLIAFSFGLQDSFINPVVMAAAILAATATSNIATSLPSSQGGVGPFEFFAAATLTFFGVNAGVAAAFAVTVHVVLLVPVTIAGLLWLWTENLSLTHLTRGQAIQIPLTSEDSMNTVVVKGDDAI